MSEATPFEAIVDQILSGKAPENVRAAAARGALPLAPETLVRLQIALLKDENPGITGDAKSSLDKITTESLLTVLGEPSCAPEVVDHFAKRAARDEKLAELIAFRPDVSEDALSVMAATGTPAVIELVMTNQERMLQHPALLDRLMINPTLRPDQQGRLLELIDRAVRSQQRAKDSAPASSEHPEELELEIDAERAARLLEVDVGELLSASEILGAEELEASEDPGVRGAYQLIITLNTAQKAVMAMKGGREERQILIRDTNKIVALGVLKNPRLSDLEVESIARMRNVTDEVLRQVANNREWSKSYAIARALVSNPRTPQNLSTNFIPRLTNRDLKVLCSNRDVPELVRRMAKRTHDLRTQKQGKSFRKKH